MENKKYDYQPPYTQEETNLSIRLFEEGKNARQIKKAIHNLRQRRAKVAA